MGPNVGFARGRRASVALAAFTLCPAAALAQAQLLSVAVSPDQADPGGAVTLTYTVDNTSPDQTVDVGLDASITQLNQELDLTDPANDAVRALPPGQSDVARSFDIPASAPAGVYAVTFTLREVLSGGEFGSALDAPRQAVLLVATTPLAALEIIPLDSKGFGGFYGPAQQGIAWFDGSFYASNGTCVVPTKGDAELFRFDANWFETDSQTVPNVGSDLCHIGGIDLHDASLYAPRSGETSVIQLSRFDPATLLQEAAWDVAWLGQIMTGATNDLGGVAVEGDGLWGVTYEEPDAASAHLVRFDLTDAPPSGEEWSAAAGFNVQTFPIDARWANDVAVVGPWAYVAAGAGETRTDQTWTFDGVTYAEIHVYDLPTLDDALVNEPIAVYAYDVGESGGGIDAHAEGLTFQGTDLWVAGSHGRDVRRIETPDLPRRSADLNGDGAVDGADLGLLLQAWSPTGPTDSAADLNGDDAVDGADLGLLLQAWSP